MIVLNFSHPFTDEQLMQIEQISGNVIENVITLPVQFENAEAFLPQLETLFLQLALSPEKLQTMQILVNLPSLNFISSMVLAELHGRMGYFPPIIRLRSVKNSLPPKYEVAEIINLQNIRDEARKKR